MPAYKYDEKKNPKGAYYTGIPLRDLTAEEYKALDDRQKEQVAASEWYKEVAEPKKAAALPPVKTLSSTKDDDKGSTKK